MEYIELHCHSAFSFLDGASLPHELLVMAAELGHAALALTDHDSVSGAMEHAETAQELGLRAIHGAEISLDDGRHLTLLVRDGRGWRNLCRLLTRAHEHTREYRGAADPLRGRTSPVVAAPSVTVADVVRHAEGLVCLSGCAARGVQDEETMRALLRGFGRDALRVELQRPFERDDRARNRRLAALAELLGVPCVATGNVHAHTHARARLQDVLVTIREHSTIDASEPMRRGNHSHVLASPAAMAARFADHPGAVAESVRLAETLTFDLKQDLGYRYPREGDVEADRELRETCSRMFDVRYRPGDRHRRQARERLEEELRVIAALGLSGFFLQHHDVLELAREVANEVRGGARARSLLPPGRGRGSSVSSIVCYLTGLSHIDPIENKLELGRFLSEGVTSVPDIDLDFPRDVRARLIPRIRERYGDDRTGLVAAFPTFKARGAIREIGAALGLPPGEIERVARGSESGPASYQVGSDIDVALGEGRRTGRWQWLAELSAEAYGLPRHLSQHSGGMVISTRPLIDCCPVVPAAMEGRQMVMWDKDSCSDAGFLKIDLLGLGMLSSVERCVELIHQRRPGEEPVDLSRIPFDDAATYASIQRAETTGVFQIESRAQMGSLRRTRPRNLAELAIQVAIVRPGPIVGGAVNPYIERRQRLREDPDYVVPYEHPSLEPPLRETLGTIIFQDQVIEVAQAFAGFTPAEAAGLRRAMSRKRSEAAMAAFHERFVARAQIQHPEIDEALAERVWSMVSGFAGFGFPKAHGAAFGLLAYQSAWLREHHPAEFLCSLLDEQPMGFYPPDALVHEAQRRGIAVLVPDVNASSAGCTVVEDPGGGRRGAVRLGLGYVLGVRADDTAALVAAREADGPFTTLDELAARAAAARPALEQLAWSGACDALVLAEAASAGHELAPLAARRIALWRLGAAAPARRVGARGNAGTQLALPLELPAPPRAPGAGHPAEAGRGSLRPLDRWAAMIADYATTSLTTADHPLTLLRGELRGRGAIDSAELERGDHGASVLIGGLVVARQRPGTAKGVVFLLLEDEHGTVNLIIPPPVYERDRLAVRTEPLVVARGRLERHPSGGGAINVLVSELRRLDAPGDAGEHPAEPGRIRRLAPAAVPGELVATGTDDFRAVAPPAMSFASGRRR